VLAGSGHIAGVVNRPGKKVKYKYWTGDDPIGSLDKWIETATEHPGSWWPDWTTWLASYSGEKITARDPSAGPLQPIEDAPGSYVKSQDVAA